MNEQQINALIYENQQLKKEVEALTKRLAKKTNKAKAKHANSEKLFQAAKITMNDFLVFGNISPDEFLILPNRDNGSVVLSSRKAIGGGLIRWVDIAEYSFKENAICFKSFFEIQTPRDEEISQLLLECLVITFEMPKYQKQKSSKSIIKKESAAKRIKKALTVFWGLYKDDDVMLKLDDKQTAIEIIAYRQVTSGVSRWITIATLENDNSLHPVFEDEKVMEIAYKIRNALEGF